MATQGMGMLDPTKTPSGMPPPGGLPNLVNPPSQAPIANAVVTVTLGLAMVFVALRLHIDVWISRKLEAAGWACFVAMAASISFCAVFYLTLSQHILGRHIWDVPISMNSNSSVQNFTVLNILYGPVEFLAKLSVLMLYLRVFGVRAQTRILTYIAIAINLIQCLINVIGYAIVCVPAPGQSWEIADAGPKCEVTGDLLGVVTAAISIFNDFFIIAIPIPAVMSLQLPTKKKVGVIAIFLAGLLVCMTSILNLVYRIRLWRSPQHDNTWNGAISYMLSIVEINVAITCSCMPSLTAFISRHHQLLRSLRSHLRFPSFSRRKNSKHSESSDDMVGVERIPSEDARYNGKLTLGSAVRDGRFLRTVDEGRFGGVGGGEEVVVESGFDRRSQMVNPEYVLRAEGEERSRETVRNGYELRSFPGGARDEEKGVGIGERV